MRAFSAAGTLGSAFAGAKAGKAKGVLAAGPASYSFAPNEKAGGFDPSSPAGFGVSTDPAAGGVGAGAGAAVALAFCRRASGSGPGSVTIPHGNKRGEPLSKFTMGNGYSVTIPYRNKRLVWAQTCRVCDASGLQAGRCALAGGAVMPPSADRNPNARRDAHGRRC